MTFIAPSFPERSLPLDAAAEPAAARQRMIRGYFMLLAFFCFFPYPALSLGNRTGLQISQMMTLAIAPVLLLGAPTRAIYAYIILAGPRLISAFYGVMRPDAPEIDIIPKEAVSSLLAVCPLLASTRLFRTDSFRTLLVGVSIAVIAHSLLGFYQVYAFSHDEYPFLFLYRNPSFKEMSTWAEVYAIYVKRPCGLFPEPSALAAAVGPWLVVLAGILADPVARARYCPAKFPRWLYGGAALAGFVLLSLSRSGLAPMVLLAVIVAVLAQARALVRALGPKALVAGLGVTAFAGAGVLYFVTSTGENLDARIESSWGIRTLSIVTGLTANTKPLDVMFGVGPGQSTVIIRKILAGVPLSKGQDDMAIWSLTVAYYMESGALAAFAMLAVLTMICRALFLSSARLLGLAALGVWTVGVTLTTSYPHLSSIWLFLGALLEWDRIFPARTDS